MKKIRDILKRMGMDGQGAAQRTQPQQAQGPCGQPGQAGPPQAAQPVQAAPQPAQAAPQVAQPPQGGACGANAGTPDLRQLLELMKQVGVDGIKQILNENPQLVQAMSGALAS